MSYCVNLPQKHIYLLYPQKFLNFVNIGSVTSKEYLHNSHIQVADLLERGFTLVTDRRHLGQQRRHVFLLLPQHTQLLPDVGIYCCQGDHFLTIQCSA